MPAYFTSAQMEALEEGRQQDRSRRLADLRAFAAPHIAGPIDTVGPDLRKEFIMTVERALSLIAGTFVVLSVLLGMYVNAAFLWFTVFVGLNLFQSAFTNWCPMMVILRKSGLRDAGETGTPITSAT
jgi:Inner membrane protein YgaP-like, transmembrane domain